MATNYLTTTFRKFNNSDYFSIVMKLVIANCNVMFVELDVLLSFLNTRPFEIM